MPNLSKSSGPTRWLRVLAVCALSLDAAAQAPNPPPVPPLADPTAPAPAEPGAAAAPAAPANPDAPATLPGQPPQVQPPLPQPGAPGDSGGLYIPDISGIGPGVTLPLPPPKPPMQRVYRVGKFVIKYATNVRERNPNLPSDSELSAATVSLLESKGILYHAAKQPSGGSRSAATGLFATTESEQNERADRTDLDQALHPPAPAGMLPEEKPEEKPAADTKKKPEKKTEPKQKGTKDDGKIPPGIPKAVVPDGKPVTLKVSDFGEPRSISAMALLDVYDAIVQQLTDRGLIGVYVLTSIEPRSGTDGRASTADVNVEIYVSELAKIRTIARHIPWRLGDLPKINDEDAADGQAVKDPKHLWIKEKSPVFVFSKKKGGGLLEKQRLQDYLSRLNRFPGRRVDAAINATGEPGKVMLDYLIREQKPYMIYLQTTNNGVPSTGDWRNRAGVEFRQLANMDDVLRLEYTTTDLQRFNSGIVSYQFALDKPDVLKMRLYGLYGDFSAEDVGFAGANFTGDSLTAGLALTWTPLYWHGFPLDLTVGGDFLRVSVDNELSALSSAASFILPYVGVGTERVTDRYSFAANLQAKASFNSPDAADMSGLGRFEPDGTFVIVNADMAASFFLEPLIFGRNWGNVAKDGEKWWRGMLANEIALLARGQFTPNDRRLVPQLMYIGGGFNTVRGYPESFASGDSGFNATFEYRLHIPRLFKPSDVSERQKAAKTAREVKSLGGRAPAGTPPPAQPEPVVSTTPERGGRSPFRLRPASPGTGADWDLIFRAFADYGQTFNNRQQDVIETDRTLISAGAGLELQVFRPLYMTIRAEYGVVLQSQTELLVDPIDAGDGRLHISATIAW